MVNKSSLPNVASDEEEHNISQNYVKASSCWKTDTSTDDILGES